MERDYPTGAAPECLLRVLLALVDKLDHIHDDLVTLRDVAGRPRPECYTLPAPFTQEEWDKGGGGGGAAAGPGAQP